MSQQYLTKMGGIGPGLPAVASPLAWEQSSAPTPGNSAYAQQRLAALGDATWLRKISGLTHGVELGRRPSGQYLYTLVLLPGGADATSPYQLFLPTGGTLLRHQTGGATCVETTLPAGVNTIEVRPLVCYVLLNAYTLAQVPGSTAGTTASPTTTVTGGRVANLQFTYPSAPAAKAALARTKFNAKYVITDSEDDGFLHAIQVTHELFKTLQYDDGTGVKIPFHLGLAPFGTGGGTVEIHANDRDPSSPFYTYAQVRKAYDEGAGVLNHSQTHQDATSEAGYLTSVQDWHNLMKLRTGITMKGFVVPSNYAGYPKAAFDAGYLKVESAGTGGGYPLFNAYVEARPVPFSDYPAYGTRYVHRRVDLDGLGYDGLDNAGNRIPSDNRALFKGYIDDLVNNTWATPPAKLGFFSHGRWNESYATEFFNYVLSQCGKSLWFPALDELGEYEQLLALGILTQSVSGNVLTVKVDASAMPADARWLDFSALVPPGFTSAVLSGALGFTFNAATGLVNVYNTAGQVPTGAIGGTAATPGPSTSTGATGATSPATTSDGTAGGGTTTGGTDTSPATGPTAQLKYDGSRSYSDSNTNDHGFLDLFDGDLDHNAEFGNPITPTWKQTYPFFPQQRTRLDYVLLKDMNGKNPDPGIEYVYCLVGETTERSLGFFTGPDYGPFQRLDFPALSKAVAYVRSRDAAGQVQPAEIQFFGAQVDYSPPLYQLTPKPFLAGVNGNWYDFVSTSQAESVAPHPYGALNSDKLVPMDHLGITRMYVDQNDIIRSKYTGSTAGPEIPRIAPAYHGENYDVILADRRQKGLPVRLCVTNLKASTAATWPDYVDYNPYVAAHTDANGNQVPEQLPQPWLNNTTMQSRAYGDNPQDPATWAKGIGKIFFNLAARYGKVKVDPARTWWATSKLNDYDTTAPTNVNGLNLLDGLEACNELDQAFKGVSQYLSVADEAMMASVIKDNHKGAIQGDTCMAAADPSLKLYGMGVSYANPRRYRALMAEFARIRGYRADGSIDCPYDMQCFHEYPRDPQTGAGLPLEVSDSLPKIADLVQARAELQPTQLLSLGEIGYADQADATGYVNGYVQGYSYCPPSASYTTPQRIAHWNLRNVYVALAAGVDEAILYTANRIATAGAVNPNWDMVNGLRNSPTEFFTAGSRALLAGYLLQGYVQNPTNVAGQARVQKWTAVGKPDIYCAWMGSLDETTAPFTLSLPGATQLTRCMLQYDKVLLVGTTVAISGTYSGTATEQPVFYYVGVPDSSIVAVADSSSTGGTTTSTSTPAAGSVQGSDQRTDVDAATGAPTNITYEGPLMLLSGMAGSDGVIRINKRNFAGTSDSPAILFNCGPTPVVLTNVVCTHPSGQSAIQGGENNNVAMTDVAMYCTDLVPSNDYAHRPSISLYKPTKVDIQYVTYEAGGGIYVDHWNGGDNLVRIKNVRSRNVIGKDGDFRHCIQLSNVHSANMDVEYIENYNEPDKSRTEDTINLYNCGGTSADAKMKIKGLYLHGAYPYGALSQPFTGAMLSADGSGDPNETHSQYIDLQDAFLRSACGAAANIATGHDISYKNIYGVTCGYLPDGRRLNTTYRGFWIGDYYNLGAGSNNAMSGITTYYARTKDLDAGTVRRADFIADPNDSTDVPNPGIDVQGATLLPAPASVAAGLEMERQVFLKWRDYLNANGQTCGSRYVPV